MMYGAYSDHVASKAHRASRVESQGPVDLLGEDKVGQLRRPVSGLGYRQSAPREDNDRAQQTACASANFLLWQSLHEGYRFGVGP